MADAQFDLFGSDETATPRSGRIMDNPPEDLVVRIRGELERTVSRVRTAERELPWRDLTEATLAELRFHSVARWLPEEEARALCRVFQAELDRLYAVLDGQAGDAGGHGPGGE